MNQIAIVTQIAADGTAIVETSRKSMCDFCEKGENCSHDCEITGLFAHGKTMTARAKNTAGASVGDVVELDTPSQKVLTYAAAVFIAPVAFALIFYFIFTAISLTAGYIASAAGFVLTFAAVYFIFERRSKKTPDIEIVNIRISAGRGEPDLRS